VPPDDAPGGTATTLPAFSLPLEGLSADGASRFDEGTVLFDEDWVVAPSAAAPDRDGLGPTANATSCASCHHGHGKGVVPADVMDPRAGLVIRLSVPGVTPTGAPVPEPTYGDQLQDRGSGWAPHEGRVLVTPTDEEGSFADGTGFRLQRPTYTIGDLQFGDLAAGTMISPRVAPSVIGLGLLEAVPSAEVLAGADPDDADGDGISGRPNLVWDQAAGALALGRFGWKAGQPSVGQATTAALHDDLGITSPARPTQNCPAPQVECSSAPSGAPGAGGTGAARTEADADAVETLTFYTRTLAVPVRRDLDDRAVGRGGAVFCDLGCASCHRPSWTTGADAEPALAGRTIEPYTDLLLHDLGEGLADGRPEFGADGREWRTAPLWGIGLVRAVTPDAGFLHDGRARTLEEAILWHGGEAGPARERYRQLPAGERAALLAFLGSL
jgi:CxxC motif-containing protein (DUF1111 family)